MDSNPMLNENLKSNRMKRSLAIKNILFRCLLSVIIILIGVIGANYLTKSAPKARKKPPAKMIPFVQAIIVYPAAQAVVIPAMGTVIPAREMILKSRVSGEIVQIHPDFKEGSFLKKGTDILQIDDADYRLAIAKKQSAVANARYALKLEQGHQIIAKMEWEMFNKAQPAGDKDVELALRKPHLKKALADLASAEADIKQAMLNLDRTVICTPFNAIVRATRVEVGSQITPQESLGELAGADEYWIKVSIPVDRLKWITIPRSYKEQGSKAKINYRSGAELAGTVIKLLGDLEPDGRMARLLVSVKDPLGLQSPDGRSFPILIGEYVRVSIDGRQINDAYRIPVMALRDNAYVWIAGEDDKLKIRKIETLWRDKDMVLLQNGLYPGERLIVSDIAAPISGMQIKVEGER